ncbi:MAG: beta-propeller fold lactonase family protein, partial [Phycisphaerales bacterium]
NISNPATPTLVATVATGTNPYSVAVSGSFAYVVNYFVNTLQVFNISNPAAPTLVATVATGGQPVSVAVSGSFAYVVNQTSSTLQVFNISNPAAPTLVGSVVTGDGPNSVAVLGSFAYVANFYANTLQVFNCSNPAAPTLAGSVATGFWPFSVAASGSFAYVANAASNNLQVFKAVSVGFGAPLAASSLAGVNGSGLENLDASKITTGTLAAAQIPNLDASKITTGTLATAQIPNLDASKITTGTLADARLSTNVALLGSNQTFTGTTNFTSNVGIGTAASQAILDVRGSGTFRNGHIAYFQNNDATGSGIAIQINATRTSAQNNFATFYNAAGAVVGRIEGFDLQSGDWVPPPDLPVSIAGGFSSMQVNPGVTVRPTADWFNPGSLPSASLQGGRLPSSSLVGGRLPSSSLVGGRSPSASLDGGSPPSLSINWTAFTFNFNPGSFPALNFDPGAFPTLAFDPGAFPTLAFDPGAFPTLAFNPGSLPSASSPVILSTPSISFTLPTEADLMPLTTWAVESNLQGLIAITPLQAAVNVASVAAMRAAKDGGITYGSKGADYAEYLMKVDPKDDIQFGEVVGIFGGKISRKTDGAERVMVISQAPAVVGNQPPDAERSAYEMVAFMGQVPVAVVGGATVGDFIAASGKGNGVAVAIHPADLRPEHMERIVGRAWANSVDDRFDFINTHIGAKEEAAAMLLDREIKKNEAAAEAAEAMEARLRRLEELLGQTQR